MKACKLPSLDWILTLIALSGFLTLTVFANWKASRPWDDMKPRQLPWRMIMIVSGFGVVLALVHIANLFGVETGPDKSPFGRF